MVCRGFNELEEEYGKNTDHVITKVDAESFNKSETLAELSGYNCSWFVNVICELYVLAKRDGIDTINVHKYSHEKNAWVKVKVVRTRLDYYSVCSFLNKVYVVGGLYKNMRATSSCFEIDTSSRNENQSKV